MEMGQANKQAVGSFRQGSRSRAGQKAGLFLFLSSKEKGLDSFESHRSIKLTEKRVSEKGNQHGEAKRVRMNTYIRGEMVLNEG